MSSRRMKYYAAIAFLVVVCCVFTVRAEEPLNHSVEFGLGFPRGVMDISANGLFTLAFPVGQDWQFRTTFHETFSAKKIDGHYFSVNVVAGYALARFGCNQPWRGFAPFAEVGAGLHLITSYASSSSAVTEGTEWKLLSKAHGFVGAEYSFDGDKLLSIKVRFTYPSDLLLDAVYLNYGIRF